MSSHLARSTERLSLDSILGDLPAETFLREYLGHKFVPLPGPRGRFSRLLSWEALNRLLETQSFTKGTLQMTREAQEVPPESVLNEYTKLGRTTVLTKVVPDGITKHLRDGAALIVNEIHKPVPEIADLVESLETALNARISVNMYFSMYEKHGFACHYDAHDVLILQVHGQKHWQIYGPRAVTPYPHEGFDRTEQPPATTPVWDEPLVEGDALYLPRGYWHFAKPVGVPTVHLTVGIVRANGLDFLNWMTKQLSRDEIFRRDVPQEPERAASYLAAVRDAVMEAVTQVDLAPFMRDIAIEDSKAQNWRRARFGLPWSATPEGLPPSDHVSIHITTPYGHGLKAFDAADVPGSVDLYQNGKAALRFRAAVRPLCDYLTMWSPVTIEEFLAHFRDTHTEAALRDFLQQLATPGLIVFKECAGISTDVAHVAMTA